MNNWVKTADQLPDGEDWEKPILVVEKLTFSYQIDISEIGWVRAHPDHFPYWMDAPELPDELGGKA
jgi:hypothetical protein